MKKEKRFYLWEKAANVALALWHGYFVYVHLEAFLMGGRISSLLIVILETMSVLFFLLREMPKEASFSPYDWTIALGGTLTQLLLRPAAVAQETPWLYALHVLGILLVTGGLAALNKSIGVVPANRGIKSGGLYRLIRHPIYAGYILATGAFVAQNPTLHNTLVFAASSLFHVLRILSEEAFLKRQPTYSAYMKQTRWRLLPFIW